MAARDDPHLPALARLARRHDHDRFLTTLFAPRDRRPALWALIAFNHEIAKTREVVSEPMLGEIRLQWWRDALAQVYDATPRRHEVIDDLAPAIRRHELPRGDFETLIDTREWDLQDQAPPSLDDLERYVENATAPLMRLQLRVLGVAVGAADEAARLAGLAHGMTGLLRALPVHARQRRVYLPTKLVEEVAVEMGQVFELKPHEGLRQAVRRLADRARVHAKAAKALRQKVPKAAFPPLMLAGLAESHLRVLDKADHDVFDARVQMANPMRQMGMVWRRATGRY